MVLRRPAAWACVLVVAFLAAGCSSGRTKQSASTTTTATGHAARATPTTRAPAPVISRLGRCPRKAPVESVRSLNAGVPGLHKELLPIAASSARVCRYSGPARTVSGGFVPGVAVALFANATNRLPTFSGSVSCDQPPGTPMFLVTFANSTRQVSITAEPCEGATNGVLFAHMTSTWFAAVQRYGSGETTTRTVGQTTSGQGCTQADLAKPRTTNPPQPTRVAKLFVLNPLPNYAKLDPPGNVVPAVSAAAAWHDFIGGFGGEGTTKLLLGYYSSVVPYKLGKGPEEVHVLAWVWLVQHAATVPTGGGAPPPGVTAPPQPPCYFGTEYEVLDASTGHGIAIVTNG